MEAVSRPDNSSRGPTVGKTQFQFPKQSLSLSLGSVGSGTGERVDPELSGKMLVLYRMMSTMRASKSGERIVIVSNYTTTLDLIQTLCNQSNWPTLRLDGTVSGNKRTKIVDEFNSPMSNAFAFLLSSKAGGCGINLIGGSRLVLFDPDWNPASDKQAAARIWREGQKRRCFIYRFMTTGTIEEKIIQRQLSKEGLADIVDNKEQVNQFSTDELRQLFSLHQDTRSDTHDTLRCKRCNSVKVRDSKSEKDVFPDAQVNACIAFLEEFSNHLVDLATSHRGKSVDRPVDDAIAEGATILPFAEDIQLLRTSLERKELPSLPKYSRRQRETFEGIERYHVSAKKEYQRLRLAPSIEEASSACPDYEIYANLFPANFSIYSEFLRKWTDVVPKLASLVAIVSNPSGSSEAEELCDEFVEQEGCPEETDFNRWSHHCSVDTCDDELLVKSMRL